jgi:hypothetical protein
MCDILTAVLMKILVFWNMTPCSLVLKYRRFRGACRLHLRSSPEISVCKSTRRHIQESLETVLLSSLHLRDYEQPTSTDLSTSVRNSDCCSNADWKAEARCYVTNASTSLQYEFNRNVNPAGAKANISFTRVQSGKFIIIVIIIITNIIIINLTYCFCYIGMFVSLCVFILFLLYLFCFFLPVVQQPYSGLGRLIVETHHV